MEHNHSSCQAKEIPKQLPWELQALNGTISSSELISEDNLAMVKKKIAINFWVHRDLWNRKKTLQHQQNFEPCYLHLLHHKHLNNEFRNSVKVLLPAWVNILFLRLVNIYSVAKNWSRKMEFHFGSWTRNYCFKIPLYDTVSAFRESSAPIFLSLIMQEEFKNTQFLGYSELALLSTGYYRTRTSTKGHIQNSRQYKWS